MARFCTRSMNAPRPSGPNNDEVLERISSTNASGIF